MSSRDRVLALSGGVGGAKLVLGLSQLLDAEHLTVVANTGDDFEHLGLTICPDLDTVMYTLAGLSNAETGWGLAGETWSFLDAMERLGGPAWFRLGDRDLATHVRRSELLRAGRTLSEVTAELCAALGVDLVLLPMSDHPVRTRVRTEGGELAFQEYFVRERCEPVVEALAFAGAAVAAASPGLLAALDDPRLAAVVVTPSNPFLSIDPLLALPAVEDRLRAAGVPRIAVSPIVGGEAIKGPAAKLLRELGRESSALAVAEHYVARGVIDGFVLDEVDAALADAVGALGVEVLVAPTVMRSLEDRVQLAKAVLDFAGRL